MSGLLKDIFGNEDCKKGIEVPFTKKWIGRGKYYGKCRCPKCRKIVIPRRINYFVLGYSGLLWCPKCLQAEARLFWMEVELSVI